MNTSIAVPVSAAPPLNLAGDEIARLCEPLAARRPTPPVAKEPADEKLTCALEAIEMEDGGVALALDLCDDLAPHWLAWIEWVDARERDQRYDPAT
jgi:hypothetical protein